MTQLLLSSLTIANQLLCKDIVGYMITMVMMGIIINEIN